MTKGFFIGLLVPLALPPISFATNSGILNPPNISITPNPLQDEGDIVAIFDTNEYYFVSLTVFDLVGNTIFKVTEYDFSGENSPILANNFITNPIFPNQYNFQMDGVETTHTQLYDNQFQTVSEDGNSEINVESSETPPPEFTTMTYALDFTNQHSGRYFFRFDFQHLNRETGNFESFSTVKLISHIE